MEALRNKLHQYVTLYGPLDKRTLEISQKLDKLIVEQMAIKRTLCKGFN